MTIDATTLANYITLSVNSNGSQSDDSMTNDAMFGSVLAQAIAADSSTANEQTSASAQSSGADNMLSILYMMMGSGIDSDGQTLSLLAESFGKALHGGSSATVTNDQANNLYKLFSSGAYTSTNTVESSGSKAITPVAASVAVTPAVVSKVGKRSAELYRSVIDQFNVETNPRYAVNKKGNGDTYCNIFMWDVTRAMGAEIPHYVDPETLEPRYYPDVKGAKEMSANAIYNWLGEVGEKYGWYQVTAEQAQNLANQGHPVVTARHNANGHGHVQVVCPSEDGKYDAKRGVTIAQAGRRLRSYTNITEIYSNPNEVTYYAHA